MGLSAPLIRAKNGPPAPAGGELGEQFTSSVPILGKIATGDTPLVWNASRGVTFRGFPYAAGTGKLRNSCTVQRWSARPAAIAGVRSR